MSSISNSRSWAFPTVSAINIIQTSTFGGGFDAQEMMKQITGARSHCTPYFANARMNLSLGDYSSIAPKQVFFQKVKYILTGRGRATLYDQE